MNSHKATRTASRAFPWDEAMRLGFGVLRHTSDAFWRMTPRELKTAADGVFRRGNGGPDRRALDALMNAFPDTETS